MVIKAARLRRSPARSISKESSWCATHEVGIGDRLRKRSGNLKPLVVDLIPEQLVWILATGLGREDQGYESVALGELALNEKRPLALKGLNQIRAVRVQRRQVRHTGLLKLGREGGRPVLLALAVES
ncbi:MAG: hypothetical protein EOP62_11810 [Sphingomonadales bacterium]|nr:MAG: hypothetical protein EOP62_11810 [Sphingomonadales bacterium]